jgi:hypothetical protein
MVADFNKFFGVPAGSQNDRSKQTKSSQPIFVSFFVFRKSPYHNKLKKFKVGLLKLNKDHVFFF